MRQILLPSLFVAALAACDSAGQSPSGQLTQNTDATGADDGLVADASATTTGDTAATTDPTSTTGTTSLPPVDATDGPRDSIAPPSDTATQPGDTGATTPPGDTASPPSDAGDTVGPSGGAIGAACSDDGDCAGGARAACLGLPGGYCALAGCDTDGCPDGASCWGLGDAGSFCIQDCAGPGDCRTGEGYVCDADATCWFYDDTPPTGGSPVGGPCTADEDCADAGAFCYPEVYQGEATGFVGGYCMIPDCTAASCPAGATCQAIFSDGGTACVDGCGTAGNGCNAGYGCFEPGMCFPSCAESGCPTNYACDAESDTCLPSCTPTSCAQGTVCKADGTCGPPPCTANSCGAGYTCAPSGDCVPDLAGGPGPGPGPACAAVPTRDCSGAACLNVTAFEPDEGPGYWDYPINGETAANEYRSYANGHLQALVKWATAMVDCKAAGWGGGNGEPLGLGDMSEADGSIPGTSIGSPGHPEGTHEDGVDMDIAYYQVTSADNKLRPICPNANNHCTAPPNNLDLWRQAYVLGLVMQSPRVRVIGVDGQVGPLVEQAIDVLCGNGWLSGVPCTQSKLAYEVTDEGLGWFYFHLHHWHVSTYGGGSAAPSLPGARECLRPGCDVMTPAEPLCAHGDGPALHAPLLERPLRLQEEGRGATRNEAIGIVTKTRRAP